MRVDESAALEQLRQCERDLEAYAAERGLTVRLDPAYPGAPPPEQQPGPLKHAIWSLIGQMPGGSIGKLRHQAVFGNVTGMNADGGHTVLIGRQPETVAYVPLLNVRPDEFGAGLFEWAGDKRPRQRQEFESSELNRRFVIEIAKGQDQVWLYRLFTPTLIDWLAHETPPDFGFRLSSGSFNCELPQWRGQDSDVPVGQVLPDRLDQVAAVGGKVAGRICDEVLEQVGLGEVPRPRSADGYRNWTKAERGGRLGRLFGRPPLWFDRDEVVAAARSENLPGDVLAEASGAGLGVATGGGSAVLYRSSTGWEGRPGKADVRAMLEVAPRVFAGLDG